MEKFIEISQETCISDNKCLDNIYLFTQFFLHKDLEHREEIKYCLKKNVENNNINHIILLNEQIYSDNELGISSSKIKQINIGVRLQFSDVFNYVIKEQIKGYIIICNSDIFLTNDLNKLRISDIHEKKKMFSLLRYEYRDHENLNDVSLFGSFKDREEIINGYVCTENIDNDHLIDGARSDSFDTWIIHTNFMISENENNAFNIRLGTLGCDNKLIYIFKILGYIIYNDPIWLPTYHYHKTDKRDYDNSTKLPPPYGLSIPARTIPMNSPSTIGINIPSLLQITNNLSYLNFTNDNNRFINYIKNKIDNDINFIIPRITGEENNFCFLVKMFEEKRIELNIQTEKYLKYDILKKNGINLSTYNSSKKYSELYLKCFEHSDIYCIHEFWCEDFNKILQSLNFIMTEYQRDIIWSNVFNIYNYLYNPWTWTLRGKKILIISPYIDLIKQKIDIQKEIYNVNLFPECKFIFLKSPQCYNPDIEFDKTLNDYYSKLADIKDDFDIAICNCNGLTNLVCDYIYTEMNKSSIYIDDTLLLYFGIYNKRFMTDNKEICRIYLNKNWNIN
jgi:hypothetical protein